MERAPDLGGSGARPVPESLARIHATLDRLALRERRLLVLRAAFGGVAGIAFAWALLAVLVNTGVATRDTGSAWIGLAVAAVCAVAAWPLRAWKDLADPRRQARRVEDLEPDLRGQLLAVLDRGARPLGPAALLDRMAVRIAPTVGAVAPARAWPDTPVRRAALWGAGGIVLLGLVGAWFERGPLAAVATLFDAPAAVAKADEPVPDGPRALVGDITLRYLYPAYTRLEPMEVPNSNGEVHAPPGTRVEVRARTAEAWASASLRVYDLPLSPVEVQDGRQLRAAFDVAGPGIWRFEFGELPSPDYRIVPDPDLAPEVTVETRARAMTVNADKPLPLVWMARDDFGIHRVEIEVTVGKEKRSIPVRELQDVPREAAGDARLTPAQLGLLPGDEATIRVAAWDNDEVTGSKPGYSAAIQVEVLGPRGRQARQDRYRKALRDALVLVLADFVVEPEPVAKDGARAGQWATAANARYQEFDRLVQEAWGGAEPDSFDATLIRELGDRRRELFGFARALGDANLSDRDEEAFVGLQAGHVAAVEGAVLMLDQVVRAAAMANLAELVEQVAAEARSLQADAADLSKGEMLARLDRLQRKFAELARQAAKLDEGGLKEFLNDRTDSAERLADEIRKAIAAGDMEKARALMERLAQQMQAMADDLKQMQSRSQEQADQLRETLAKMDEDLGKLQQDQQALRERTEAAREKYGQDMERAVKAWEEIERLSAQILEKQGALDETLAPFRDGDYGNRAALDDVRAEAEGLHDSARARDLETASARVDRVLDAMGWLGARLSTSQRRGTSGGADLAAADRALKAEKADATRIRKLLEEMMQQQSRSSPQLQQELQQMAGEQEALAERAREMAGQAGQVAGQLPMKAPGLERGTQQAAEQGERAAEAMQQGEAMDAEGGQRAAEAGIQEAREALQEAQRNMEDMRRASQQRGDGKEEGGEGGGKDGDGGGQMDEEIALPAPEEFATPEEYRRALLEGMSGEVPQEYETLNRRYYEELVRQ